MALPPDYRLATVLTLRERKKEQAEHHLAACLKALREEQQRQREMEEELERMIAKRQARTREYAEKTMRGEMSAQDAIGANVYLERLKELEEEQKNAIEAQKAVVRQRQEDVDAARQDVLAATQELKAIEKHKEKWTEEVKKEREAKEEEVMDEIAQTIFINRDG
ncbi:MAG: hypothetical protein AAB426_12595 [Myxococcota bacterium]